MLGVAGNTCSTLELILDDAVCDLQKSYFKRLLLDILNIFELCLRHCKIMLQSCN